MSSSPLINLPSHPPETWEPLRRAARLARLPLERFLRIEAASGTLLLMAAAVALAWANSPWRDAYLAFWHTPLGIRLGAFEFTRPLEWLVNDGLMAIFFFVVGLEIRRELHHGELSEARRAALPAAAALGGMVAPALLYLLVAGAPATRAGWGVPMATDIAFALGVLTLLGKRVTAALRVLLLALAVIDDLGAIVVIAVFYSSGIAPLGLVVAGIGFASILVLQRSGVRAKSAYAIPAVIAWAGTYAAGVHPTIAGVMIGLLTPVQAWYGAHGFVQQTRQQLDDLNAVGPEAVSEDDLAHRLDQLRVAQREAISPTESLIHTLHPWVAFGIMPLFALANAGVSLDSTSIDADGQHTMLGTALGLVIGKPIGVLAACALALRLRIASLPQGIGTRQLLVLAMVAGIGFTMALFIAQLAFDRAPLLAAAKLGILAASAAAAVLTLVAGRALLPVAQPHAGAQTADEAEHSTAL